MGKALRKEWIQNKVIITVKKSTMKINKTDHPTCITLSANRPGTLDNLRQVKIFLG